MLVYSDPRVEFPDPNELPPAARIDPLDTWNFAVDSLGKRLRTARVDAEWASSVEERARSLIWANVAEWERVHHAEHPARRWERGERGASAPQHVG
jgi:hypothetical protein